MKGNESHGGPALRGSICHCGCAIRLRCWQRMKDMVETRQSGGGGNVGSKRGDETDVWPSCPTIGYQIAYCLANSNSSMFTTLGMGAMVRRFMATELAPESAYIFRLMIKMRQGWGSP